MRRSPWLLLILLAVSPAAWAQSAPAEPARVSAGEGARIAPSLAQLVAERRLRRHLEVRWDAETGAPASLALRQPLPLPPSPSPEAAARRFLTRVAPLYGPDALGDPRDAARLPCVGAQRVGDLLAVDFLQTLEGVPVHGARLRVLLTRRNGRACALGASGRIYRGLPRALPRPRPELGDPRAPRLGGATLDAGSPAIVLARLDGWRLVRREVELGATGPREVLRGPDGAALRSRPWGLGAHVDAQVVLRDPSQPPTRVPLPGLLIRGDDGRLHRSDAQGRFPASGGALLGGLLGEREGVWATQSSYPSGAAIQLGAPHRAEATAYFHLARTRTWLARYADRVPGLRRSLQARTLALVTPGRSGAWALRSPTEVGGRRYDYSVLLGFFGGRHAALDPTVVSHERIHTLLYGLGFHWSGEWGGVLHEACADYFAAVIQGERRIGRYTLGPLTRDLRELRRWPQHRAEEDQTTGRIFSGALLDARDALGEGVDLALLSAIGGFTGGTDLFAARDQVIAAAERFGLGRAALLPHFARHGLGEPAEDARPPVVEIEATRNETPSKGHELVYAKSSDTLRLELRATSPEGRPVELLVTGLEGVLTEAPSEAAGTRVFVSQGPMPAGVYLFTAIALDDRGLRHTLTSQLLIVREDTLVDFAGSLSVRAPLGETTHVSAQAVAATIPELRPEDVTWRLAGPAILGGQVDPEGLRLTPTAGEEGRYVLTLRGSRVGEPLLERYRVEVTVSVGEGEDFITVQAPIPAEQAARQARLAPLGPTSELSVAAGGSLELYLEGHGRPHDDPVELALTDGPDFATLLPGAEPARARAITPAEVQANALLALTPPPTHPVATLDLELVYRRAGAPAEALAHRRIRVHVTPRSENRPPELEAPARIQLREGEARFSARAVDPEGESVEVEVAWPLPAENVADVHLTRSGGTSRYRVEVSNATQTRFTIYLRAFDASGARSLRAIEVQGQATGLSGRVRAADPGQPPAERPRPASPDWDDDWGDDDGWDDEGWSSEGARPERAAPERLEPRKLEPLEPARLPPPKRLEPAGN